MQIGGIVTIAKRPFLTITKDNELQALIKLDSVTAIAQRLHSNTTLITITDVNEKIEITETTAQILKKLQATTEAQNDTKNVQ